MGRWQPRPGPLGPAGAPACPLLLPASIQGRNMQLQKSTSRRLQTSEALGHCQTLWASFSVSNTIEQITLPLNVFINS